MKIMKCVVNNCSSLANSIYADGREISKECSLSTKDEKCCDIEDCCLKKVVKSLMKVIGSNQCSRCDGCGYEEGCMDEDCGVYAAHECLNHLGVEFLEEGR